MIDSAFYSSKAGFLAAGLAGAFALTEAAETINPSPRALVIERLEYSQGVFTQRVVSTTGEGIAAQWSVEINRRIDGMTNQLCIGSGQGVYKGTTDSYATNEWVGAQCPELRAGDVAEPVWTWTDENGQVRSVSASLTIPE